MTSYQQSSFDLLANVMCEAGLSLACDQTMDYESPSLKDLMPKQKTNKVQEDHHNRMLERLRAKLKGRMDDKKIKPMVDYKTVRPDTVGQVPSSAVEAEIPDLCVLSPLIPVMSEEDELDLDVNMDITSPDSTELQSPMSVSGEGLPADGPTMGLEYDNNSYGNFAELANSIQPGHLTQDQGWTGQDNLGLIESSVDPVLSRGEDFYEDVKIWEIVEDLKTCEQMPLDQLTTDELGVNLYRESLDILDNVTLPPFSIPYNEQGYKTHSDNKRKQNWPVSGGAIYDQAPKPVVAPTPTPATTLMFDQFGNRAKVLPSIQVFNEPPQRAQQTPLITALIRHEGRAFQVDAMPGEKVSSVMDKFKHMSGLTDPFFLTDMSFRTVPGDRVMEGPGKFTFQTNVMPTLKKPIRRRLPKTGRY